MAKKEKPEAEKTVPAKSWREIRQSSPAREITGHARKRNWNLALRASGTVALLIVLVAVGTGAVLLTRQRNETALFAQVSEPIAQIMFSTDGVLTHRWLSRTLGIRKGTMLMEVDIFALKSRLEETGQVAAATVERRFPDTLVVRLRERQPVFRLATRDAQGQVTVYMVAEDGTVYPGYHYPEAMTRELLWLDGCRLKARPEGGFEPLPGVGVAHQLMRFARSGYPELAQDWRVVDLRDYGTEGTTPGSALAVRGRRVGLVRFGLEDFGLQMEKLDYILRDNPAGQNAAGQPLERIDLSLRGPVVVTFAQAQPLRPPRT